ncbi:alpha/beta hydrolase [Phenylobacterium sp.]|uniref:alpha/beta hydrolase n=1 Tax=Phenylobacterium sp. TaxID=1871053 RepID=UPI003983CA81
MLDPLFAAMIAEQAKALEDQPQPALDDLPPDMIRAGYRMQRQAQDQNAPRDVAARDLRVGGASGEIAARLYTPAGAGAQTPGLVYFHGGGFVIGDLETHDGHCRRLAAGSGARVLAVDYRLAPEHPFPAGHDDALAATRWAFDHAAEIGFDPSRIAVGGDSAGGNLAASVALDLRDDAARKLAFQLLLYPGIWPDAETASRRDLDGPILTKAAIAWFDKCLAAITHKDVHRAMLGRAKDLAGVAPALVVTAGYDPLKDEGRDYALRLRAAGVGAEHVDYPALVHDFFLMADVSPAVAQAAAETAAALKVALG